MLKEGKVPDFLDFKTREPGLDVYFDLEYIRQTRDHEGRFDDSDWQLITAISAVVEEPNGRLISLYDAPESRGQQPNVAIDQSDEITVIGTFLQALLAWQETLGHSPSQQVSLRLFNYSGSGAEGRLWSKIEILRSPSRGAWPFESVFSRSENDRLKSLLKYNSKTIGQRSNPAYGDGIERFDLARVVKALYEPFPLSATSKYGLKVVERFLPCFQRPGSLVGSEDSMATWLRIKMLRQEIASLGLNPSEDIQALADEPLDAGLVDLNDKDGATRLRLHRLAREHERLERSYKTYAEWDCRAVWFLHKALIAQSESVQSRTSRPSTKSARFSFGCYPVSSRYGLLFPEGTGP